MGELVKVRGVWVSKRVRVGVRVSMRVRVRVRVMQVLGFVSGLWFMVHGLWFIWFGVYG